MVHQPDLALSRPLRAQFDDQWIAIPGSSDLQVTTLEQQLKTGVMGPFRYRVYGVGSYHQTLQGPKDSLELMQLNGASLVCSEPVQTL